MRFLRRGQRRVGHVRIVLADDAAAIEEVAALLRADGHAIDLQPRRPESVASTVAGGAHLVLLDPSGLPFYQIIDLCRAAARSSSTLLALTSTHSTVAERIQALDAGADEWIAKPVQPDELRARLLALLRRHPLAVFGGRSTLVQVTDTLWLDLPGQALRGDRGEIALTAHEFRLLAYLVRREGAVVGRDELIRAVWGSGYEGRDREVDVYVRYLRRKVEPDPARPRFLLTRYGAGYQYQPPDPRWAPVIGPDPSRWTA